MLIATLLLTGCRHAPSESVTIRPTREVAYVKLRNETAQMLYDSLTGNAVVELCTDRGCKRAGETVICSTMNLKDSVVCELRLLPGAGLAPPRTDLRLYHSLRRNRTDGAALLDDEILRIDGLALAVMGDFVEQDTTQLWIQITAPETGELTLMREPLPR
ncbi:MAG: hypothetical protein ACI8RZ_003430 [Myxococcota bacterium]|jgi:hypothetical protein